MAKQRRRPPQQAILDITVADDGIRPVREVPEWTRNKLAILWSYLNAYAKACESARRFFFVDGLAGPGLCKVRGRDEWLLGSTMLALRVEPGFTKCLAMELDSDSVSALGKRAAAFGDRALVLKGDCNIDLVGAMETHLPTTAPVFALLDPEGTQLHWKTVESVARFRHGPRKTELLILLATSFLDRMLPRSAEVEDHNIVALNRVFPTPAWQRILEDKRGREITPEQGREAQMESYAAWLRNELGYEFVRTRPVSRSGSSASVYHLIFASDHEAGERIMDYVFRTMHPNEPNLRLPGLLD